MTTATIAKQSRNNGVRADLTPPRRTRGTVENKDFAAFAGRILRAFARRVADGDVEALADLLAFAKQIDRATQDAVDGLREFGYSWTEIGHRAGITKQTAQERWGKPEGNRAAKALRDREKSLSDARQGSLFEVTDGGEW